MKEIKELMEFCQLREHFFPAIESYVLFGKFYDIPRNWMLVSSNGNVKGLRILGPLKSEDSKDMIKFFNEEAVNRNKNWRDFTYRPEFDRAVEVMKLTERKKDGNDDTIHNDKDIASKIYNADKVEEMSLEEMRKLDEVKPSSVKQHRTRVKKEAEKRFNK